MILISYFSWRQIQLLIPCKAFTLCIIDDNWYFFFFLFFSSLQEQLNCFQRMKIKSKFQNDLYIHNYVITMSRSFDTQLMVRTVFATKGVLAPEWQRSPWFQGFLDFGTAEKGLPACTCLLLKRCTFWNVLVLDWLSTETLRSLERELFLPPTFVTRRTLIKQQWSHLPGLTSLADVPEKWLRAPSDPQGWGHWGACPGLHSSSLVQW